MRSWIRWGTAALTGVVGAGILGYLALKLAPNWFASDASCRPGDKTFGDCLAAAKVGVNNTDGTGEERQDGRSHASSVVCS